MKEIKRRKKDNKKQHDQSLLPNPLTASENDTVIKNIPVTRESTSGSTSPKQKTENMEVHSPHHLTHKKKWGEYLLEFFMLFLAVFLGFVAENKREHFIERQRVKQYARALVYDLEKDTAMIHRIIYRINRNIRITDSLASYLRNWPQKSWKNIDLFILSSPDRYPPYTWNRASLEQIKNSGNLRYFSNDSLVMRISAYDAFTRHMDEDQENDDELSNKVSQLRSLVIDMDYSKDFTMGLRNNIDSMMRTDYLLSLITTDKTSLLTEDYKQIKIFLNEKLNIRKHLIIRVEEELPRLKKDAEALIQLLKEEYHLKNE